MRCKTGITIENLLGNDLGITLEYMERRLSTVFLDGQCVDDIDRATVHNGATLALSSAMPGLVGATLRRKGILASMREAITHHEDTLQATSPVREGLITVKLFNVLSGELGPLFLTRGIYVKVSDLSGFLRMRSETFWLNVREIFLDGQTVDRRCLIDTLGEDRDKFVCLFAVSTPCPPTPRGSA